MGEIKKKKRNKRRRQREEKRDCLVVYASERKREILCACEREREDGGVEILKGRLEGRGGGGGESPLYTLLPTLSLSLLG